MSSTLRNDVYVARIHRDLVVLDVARDSYFCIIDAIDPDRSRSTE